jgi:thioredoxin 1
MKILDFWAPWCNPCKMMNPILDEIEKEYKIEIERVNADESLEMVKDYKVTSIPTYIVLDNSKNEIKRIVGAMPKFRFVNELGLTKTH